MTEKLYIYSKFSFQRLKDYMIIAFGMVYTFFGLLVLINTLLVEAIGVSYIRYIPAILILFVPGIAILYSGVHSFAPDLKLTSDGLVAKIGFHWRLYTWSELRIYKKAQGLDVIVPRLPWVYGSYASKAGMKGRGFIISNSLDDYEELEYEFRERGLLAE